MRGIQFVMLSLALGLLASCGNSDHAGIEVGNPPSKTYAFSASFVIDYGNVDYSSMGLLAKRPVADEPLLIDDFRLNLTRLAAYSSYYIYVSFDAVEGLQLWPSTDIADSSELMVTFNDENSIDSSLNETLGNVQLDDVGILKEIGVAMKPIETDFSTITGFLRYQDTIVPFEYHLENISLLELRYHHDQLDTNAEGGLVLTVRFHVPTWISGLDLSNLQLEGGVARFSSTSNVALWDSLSARFVHSFSSAHWIISKTDSTKEDAYAQGVLAQFDIIDSNWVTNGNFANGFNSWILVEQLSGVADSSIIASGNDHTLLVNVTAGGTKSYSVQLIHEDIPTLVGRRYKLVFTATSDVADSITVRLGTYNTYKTIGFQKHFYIDTLWKSYEIEYKGIANDIFTRLEFNIGGVARKFWFKDIQIYRID